MRLGAFLAAAVFLGGCAVAPVERDLSAFRAAAPRSVLVVPVVNKSLDVDAPNYVLATLALPVAEKGYYVFPIHTTKVVLEQEGFYEGERIHAQPPADLARMFGADSVLYVTINRWDAQYAILAASVTVEFEYRLVSREGVELWSEQKRMVYTPQNSSAGSPLAQLISAVVTAALTRAAPNYIPLTQQAHREALGFGPRALPDGPYRVANTSGAVATPNPKAAELVQPSKPASSVEQPVPATPAAGPVQSGVVPVVDTTASTSPQSAAQSASTVDSIASPPVIATGERHELQKNEAASPSGSPGRQPESNRDKFKRMGIEVIGPH